jgi:hypothetical protein
MDENGTPAAGRRRLRASHADREQAVDLLKAAFVDGRLTRDELDARVGRALVSRTQAELAALAADLPAQLTPDPTPVPPPARRPENTPQVRPRHRSHNAAAYRAVKSGAAAIAATIIAVIAVTLALGQPGAAVILSIFIVALGAVATAFVAGLIAAVVQLEERNRSRRQLPPGSASAKAGPPPPPPGRRDQHPAEATRSRPNRVRGVLAPGHAG